MIHEIWTIALAFGVHLWLDRVPSHENIADLPSREEYGLLRDIGAVWKAPLIPGLSFVA